MESLEERPRSGHPRRGTIAAVEATSPEFDGGTPAWGGAAAPVYAIAWRLASGGSMYAGALLAASRLSPAAQGFYFTILSLLQLRSLFELGLNQLFVQAVSHESAATRWTGDLKLCGPSGALQQLGAIVQFAVRWYSFASVAMLLLVGAGGWVYFSMLDNALVEWRLVWLTAVASSSVSLAITPAFVLLEGSGLVSKVARVRALDGVVSGVMLVAGVYLGFGLFAIAAFSCASMVIQAGWVLLRAHRPVLQVKAAAPQGAWKAVSQELLPVQRRLALSWMSGYAVFNGATPIVMALMGPDAAGRLGFGLAMSTGAMALANAWLNVRATIFGKLIRARNYAALDRLFKHVAVSTGGFLSVLLAGVWLSMPALTRAGLLNTRRILPFSLLGWMLLGAMGNYVTVCLATYLRAHKREPLLAVSVADAALAVAAAAVLPLTMGLPALCASYAIRQCGIVAPLTYLIFARCRREWH